MPLGVNSAHIAASAGEARCLEVALANGQPGGDADTLLAAIEGNHVSCVKLLCKTGKADVTLQTVISAAKHASVACIEYLAPLLDSNMGAHGHPCDRGFPSLCDPPRSRTRARLRVAGVCDRLALQGDLTALRMMAQAGCDQYFDKFTAVTASKSTSAECVRYVTYPTCHATCRACSSVSV